MTIREVTIDFDDRGWRVREWGDDIGDPRTRPVPPVMLFMAEEIATALRHGRTQYDCGALSATPTGYATATLDGRDYVYELHPARFSEQPYEPPVYIGRWPD